MLICCLRNRVQNTFKYKFYSVWSPNLLRFKYLILSLTFHASTQHIKANQPETNIEEVFSSLVLYTAKKRPNCFPCILEIFYSSWMMSIND